jgi:hypothetical protein
MVKIPDRLECLFNATIEQRGNSYSNEIPRTELERGAISCGETYRVAVLPNPLQNRDADTPQQSGSVATAGSVTPDSQTPPVSEGCAR